MSSGILKRLEGWLYLTILGVLAAGLIWPQVEQYLSAHTQVSTLNERTASHINDLSAPPPENRYLGSKIFITPATEDGTLALESGSIQTALIDQVRQNQARLVDLRALETESTIETLDLLVFRLEIEGDLQALLETVADLGQLQRPILIDSVLIKPIGRFDRPDRRLRLTLILSLWAESESS